LSIQKYADFFSGSDLDFNYGWRTISLNQGTVKVAVFHPIDAVYRLLGEGSFFEDVLQTYLFRSLRLKRKAKCSQSAAKQYAELPILTHIFLFLDTDPVNRKA
jgi:hypothetical protein